MAILRQPLQHSRQLLRNSIRNSKQLTRHPQQRTLMGLTQKEILYAKSMPPKEIGQQLIMHCGIGVARTAAALLGSDKQPLKLLAWGTKKFPKIWKDIYYAGETATEASVAAKPFRNLGVGAYFQDAREASETKAEIETAIKETMLTISVAEPGD